MDLYGAIGVKAGADHCGRSPSPRPGHPLSHKNRAPHASIEWLLSTHSGRSQTRLRKASWPSRHAIMKKRHSVA